MQDAMAIYQDLLDRMGTALVSGDAGTFLRHVALPCTIATETETIVIDGPDMARRHFDGFHAALLGHNVDAYTRIARSAVFAGADRIRGRHETVITSGGKLVAPRFGNEMEIVRSGGTWGLTHVHHHTRYVSWPDVLPSGGQRA
jgi:hypothetical protein